MDLHGRSRGYKRRWKRQQQEAHVSDLDSAPEKERRMRIMGLSSEALDAALKEVKRILDTSRHPELAADVHHGYQGRYSVLS